MKRIIKFRGYDDVEKKMYSSVDLFNLQGFNWEDSPDGELRGALILDSYGTRRNFQLTQYIDLKDKNSKEICEGDILRLRTGDISSVIYEHGGFHISPTINYPSTINITLPMACHSEVIGNIFENPELLTPDEKKS